MNQSSIRSLTYAALGTALIAVLSQITISFGPVPFTLQTLAVGLIASLYRTKETTLSIALYLCLGAISLPIFAGGSSGFQVLFGPTGGFLWGLILYGLLTSYLTTMDSSFFKVFLANCSGLALVFLGGALYFKFFNQASWSDTLAWTVTPFLLTETVKLVTIILLIRTLRPILKKEAYFQ